jgi:glycogen debranching enzyme
MLNGFSRRFLPVILLIIAGQLVVQAQTVNKFAIAANPIELSRLVKRQVFFDAAGRRAAILGSEDGRFESWVYPMKLFHDFRLTASIEGGDADIDLANYAQRVEARPESFTIVYSHPQFTIREMIFTPIDEKGSILLFDVDSAKPLTLMASFVPDLKPMWPGGLGGQSAGWNQEKKFFVISESRRKFNGLIGSPLAASGSSTPAHMLAAGGLHFEIKVDAAKARREYIPVIITGNTDGRAKCIEQYEKLAANVASLYAQTVEHYRKLREEKTAVTTPDREYNLAFEWAKVAMDKGFVINPDLGAGLIAGLGLSTDSARPGFGWFFGGDAFINSFAINGYGDFDTMRESYRFLQKFQRPAENVFPRQNDRTPGKIMHELSQAGGMIRWFEEYPYGYYHADTTPLYIVSFEEYLRQSGDLEFLRESWESLKKAYQYCLSADANGDGLMDNTIAGLGASELGSLQDDLLTDILLASATVKAMQGMAQMAELVGDEPTRREAQMKYEKGLATLRQKFFDEKSGRYAFALTTKGINMELTSWTSIPLAFRLLDESKVEPTLRTLAASDLSTDWGTRMLANSSSAYDPIAYNNGGVWLFLTGFVSLGEYAYHHSISAYHHLIQAAHSAQIDALGFSSEIWSGDYYRPLDTSVPHQLFSSGMIISPFIRGLAGLNGDALKKQLTVAPQLPARWDALDVKRYRVGSASFSISIRKGDGRYQTVIEKPSETPFDLRFAPAFGPFTKIQSVTVDGKPVPFKLEENSQGLVVAVTTRMMKRVEITIKYATGIEVDVPAPPTEIGHRTTGLKFLSLERTQTGANLQVEGLSGGIYKIGVRSSAGNLKIDGAKLISTTGEWRELEIGFEGGNANAYVKKVVSLSLNQ